MTLGTLLSLPGPFITRFPIDDVLSNKRVTALVFLCGLSLVVFLCFASTVPGNTILQMIWSSILRDPLQHIAGDCQ